MRGGQNAPLHALYYPIQWEGPSRKFLGQWVNGGGRRFIHKKFTGRSRFCRNYPLSYTCTKRNDLPLFSPSPFFKHTQAEDPDPTPVRVFCRLGIEGLLSRHCEERSDAAIRLLRPPKNQCSQKIHAAVTILPQLSGILYAYQERNQDISPITLSPLQTHTGKRP